MDQQDCCTLSVGADRRILDRLTALEKIIEPEMISQALVATGRLNARRCKLPHGVMLWVVLAMGMFTHLPIRAVFKHARRMFPGEKTPGRSSLCEARQRLGVEPLRHLFTQVVHPLGTPEMPGVFYKGFRLMGWDGTVFDVPDSDANAKAFARPSGGDRGDGAFPQVRKVSLVELGTHVEVAFAFAGIQVGEQTLVEQLLPHLNSETLLLADRGFFSYEAWKSLDSKGVKLLARVASHLILKPIQRLSDGSYLAKIYPSPYWRDRDRHGIVVRVLAYTLDDPQRVGHQEEHRLITNLLDETAYPAMELIPLYHQRWEEELVFDEQKTHQDPRRPGKPAQLRSETPTGVEQELYALSLAHFVIRALMLEAAKPSGLDVDRLSFTGCFRILQCRLPECDSRTPAALAAWYAGLLDEMSRETIPPRRNRVNPRVIKRKMSKWPKKRPQHRHRPPLTKVFIETIVITI